MQENPVFGYVLHIDLFILCDNSTVLETVTPDSKEV